MICNLELAVGWCDKHFSGTISVLRVFLYIAEAREISRVELEKVLNLSRSSVSKAVLRLFEEKLIEERVDEDDLRRKGASLTPKGVDYLKNFKEFVGV